MRRFAIDSMSAVDLATVHDIRRSCHHVAAPDEPFPTLDEWTALITNTPPGVARWHWLTDDGYAGLTRAYASARGRVEVCVRPAARRHGLGSALLNEVVAAARSLGCQTVLGRVGESAGAAFARGRGARIGNSQHRSLLPLPFTRTIPTVPGYEVVSWIGEAPEWALDSYAVARTAINDAPRSPAIPPEIWSPRRVRDMEQTVAERGFTPFVTVALDGREVVAFTELRVSRSDGATASTEDTAVVAGHRGRGLATWIKAESLALLGRNRPDVTTVVTTNDTANTAMLAINRRLGFLGVATWTDVVLLIGPDRAGLKR